LLESLERQFRESNPEDKGSKKRKKKEEKEEKTEKADKAKTDLEAILANVYKAQAELKSLIDKADQTKSEKSKKKKKSKRKKSSSSSSSSSESDGESKPDVGASDPAKKLAELIKASVSDIPKQAISVPTKEEDPVAPEY